MRKTESIRSRHALAVVALVYLLASPLQIPHANGDGTRVWRSFDVGPPGLVLSWPAVLTGDEPHYLTLTNSLLQDGDLDLKNNYLQARHGGWDAGYWFRNYDLDAHVRATRQGHHYSTHSPGMPIIIALLALPLRGTPWVEPFALLVCTAAVLLALFFTRLHAVQEHRKESFTVRLRMKGASAVARVGIAAEVRIFMALVQERRQVGLEFRSEEVAILGTRTEGRTKGATQRAVLLGTMSIRGLVATAAGDRQAARLGYGFDECRLARAILPDQVRDRLSEGQVEVPDEGEIVREPLRGRHALGNNVDAFEERRVRHVSHRRSESC